MRSPLLPTTLTIAVMLGATVRTPPGKAQSEKSPARAAVARQNRQVPCPPPGEVLDVRASGNPDVQKQQRKDIKRALEQDGSTVRLGPDVDLNFEGMEKENPNFFPIRLGRCVTLTSVASFTDPPAAGNAINNNPAGPLPTDPEVGPLKPTEARTSRSLGPVLRFGKHRVEDVQTFLEIRCHPDGAANDGARISGFRLFGPTFGAQSIDQVGVRILRCVDVEISNMEIAGWGEAGVKIEDDPGPDQCPDTNVHGGRISNPGQVRLHNNFFHHNQHPNSDDHATGYGVNVNTGAWAQISRNVFDVNRHAIAAAGDSGGYDAEGNLVLKGGGRHGRIGNTYTHMFDVHGTEGFANHKGAAGNQFRYIANSFQFRKDYAIKLRGRPAHGAYIGENVFPHPGLEDDRGDDAIYLQTDKNVQIGPGNIINQDTFGKYKVCDFDGDAVDDLFLATGATWWFASGGEFHWTYLGAKKERLDQVRLGYFDGDQRCDVLAEQNGRWMISNGGLGHWQLLGAFDAPLSKVEFGRFDPNDKDFRRGVNLRTTHAFKRGDDGQWYVTPLSGRDWKPVQSSSLPMSKLRFGDFTGDGVTDVLAVDNGRWSISESAALRWRRLNATLGDGVADLYIANMDRTDNIADILRLRANVTPLNSNRRRVKLTWTRSRNGIEPWRQWMSYVYEYQVSPEVVDPLFGFAGRFGGAGGGTLVIDQNRFGHFFSEAQIAVGGGPEWISLFPY